MKVSEQVQNIARLRIGQVIGAQWSAVKQEIGVSNANEMT